MTNRILALALCGLGIAASSLAAQPAGSGYADLVLRNGKIITVDKDFTIRSALAIRGERILDVGTDEAMGGHIGPDTRVIDLRGHAVIPGLIDNNNKVLLRSVNAYLGVDVTLASSIADMTRSIATRVSRSAPGEVIFTTSGWLPEQLVERRTPTRYDLDPVSPQNPVIVQGGHSIYLNSYALKEAGITSATESPEGGGIEHDVVSGEPTGRLFDNARELAAHLRQREATEAEKLAALRTGLMKANAVGVTSLREFGISAADFRIYEQLRRRGELTVRVSINYDLDPTRPAGELIAGFEALGVKTGDGDSWLRVDGIGEIGLDGGFESGLMKQAYQHAPGGADPRGYFGLQKMPTEKFEQLVRALNRLDLRPSIHVVGDRGVDIVLDAYEKANRDRSLRGRRWTIEHGHYTRPDQFKRMRDLDLIISTQFHPYMAAQNMTYYWGETRASKAMRVRDWLDAGLQVGGGSDWSLLPANPFWMIYFWVTRDTRLGGVIGPDQRISRAEALQVMTINNARLTMEERIKGSIEPGKLADLVVLSDDILTVPESRIRDITPLATLVGGKLVYQQSAAALSFN